MAMKLKIIGGTRQGGKNLCESCDYRFIMKGQREWDDQYICRYASYNQPIRLLAPVSECSGYYPANLPSREDMYKQAYILDPSKLNREAGFVPYKKWREGQSGDDYDVQKINDPFR